MKPTQSNTKATRASQPPHQQTPVTITIASDDDSSTESESDQQGNSATESDPDDYDSALHPPENQLGLEEWERHRRLRGISEIPKPTSKSRLYLKELI